MKGQCQIPNCQNQAKYAINKTYLSGEQKWLHVCEKHDKEIGDENERRANANHKN